MVLGFLPETQEEIQTVESLRYVTPPLTVSLILPESTQRNDSAKIPTSDDIPTVKNNREVYPLVVEAKDGFHFTQGED
jgi:hypothetical protein